MDVDLIFKIAAVGILVAVLNQLLVRSGREEQAMMTTLAGLVVVMMMLVRQIERSVPAGKVPVRAVTMETVLQIAAVCLVGAVLAAVLRQRSPEAALLLGLAVCAVVGALLLRGLADVLDMLEDLAAAGGLPPELLAPLVKTLGIALVSRLGTEICRDAGQGAMAAVLETAGAFGAVLVSLPLVRAAWELLRSLV